MSNSLGPAGYAGLQETPARPGARLVDSDCDTPAAGILNQARAGDSEAFHVIFNRYSRPILGFIYHLLGDLERAEEATQETFVRAFRGLDSIREFRYLSTWLFGIARNVVRELVREKYRNITQVELGESVLQGVSDRSIPPDEILVTGELEERVRKVLMTLSYDCRLVFVLKIFKGMKYEEISRITGSSVSKLKTDLHRARLDMRTKLRPYLGGESRGK